MHPSDTILALALLKTNWELRQHSYIDNFNLLTAECLRRSSDDLISAPDVQVALRNTFGIQLPLNTVATLLKRAARQGYAELDHGVYRVNRKRLAKLNFEELHDSALDAQDALLDALVEFGQKKFSVVWEKADAERAIFAYLAEDAITVMLARATHSYVPLPRLPERHDKYILASFVNSLVEVHSPHLDYLELVAAGNMLARGIFLPEGTGVQPRKFANTSLFFDTKFILACLGHAGQSLKAPNAELLELLRSSGAKTQCFDHTRDEVRSVLVGCARGLRVGSDFPGYGPVFDHFLARGLSESDVLLISNHLEQDLEEAGISTQPVSYESTYSIDEKKLEECILGQLRYANPNALARDIASIAAVIRMRGNSRPQLIETCTALFVTTNRPLVKGVSDFSQAEFEQGLAPVAVTDGDLTNFVWLKQPRVAPDLPRRRLVAACYAALHPSDEFRKRFLKEIELLTRTGKYSERDVYLLRHSLEARRIAMDLTLGDEEAFTSGTVSEVLEVLHLQIQREALAKADDERARAEKETARAEALRREMDIANQQVLERNARRKERAGKVAGAFAWVIAVLTSALLGGVIYLSLFSASPAVRLGATLVVGIITLITWINSSFTVTSLRERLRVALTRRVLALFAWLNGE